MAAFNDYLDLRLAVSDHVGNRTISDVMPRLIAMAEADLNRKLRCRQQIRTESLVFEDGYAQLPADYLEMISFGDSICRPLRQATIADAQRGNGYAVDAQGVICGGFSGERNATYYGKITPLKCSPACSNWLLNDYPDIYLYAAGLQAAKFLKDAELAIATDQLLSGAMQDMRIADERARWAQATVRVAGVNP